MPDISKIKIENAEYDIEDAEVRRLIKLFLGTNEEKDEEHSAKLNSE